MSLEQVLAKLKKVKRLPKLSAAVTELQRLAGDPDSNISDVVNLVKDDMSTATSVLQMANSAAYRPAKAGQSIDVRYAVNRLGLDMVTQIATVGGVINAFGPDTPLLDRRAFWFHSISVGVATQAIARGLPLANEACSDWEMMRLAGIVHDMGQLILEAHFTKAFHKAIRGSNKRGIPLIEAERLVFGTDHAEVAAWLLDQWGLAPELADIVRYHHEPDKAPDEIKAAALLINVADYFCIKKELGLSGNLHPVLSPIAAEVFGYDATKDDELMYFVAQSGEESALWMSLV